MRKKTLEIILIKPSKYNERGDVERFKKGFMPNSTLPHMNSLTRHYLKDTVRKLSVVTIDEYTQTDSAFKYRKLFEDSRKHYENTLVTLVGVQSHQFQRSLDIAALAYDCGVQVVIGGPHAMTCDTSLFHNHGIAFSLAEAELVWPTMIDDVLKGNLKAIYGTDQRWQYKLDTPVLIPPCKSELERYFVAMLGIYHSRDCPFNCNFCSVIKIAGQNVRSQSIETTIASLRAAKSAGVRLIMFTADNFNKTPDIESLLEAMIEAKIDLPFFMQCDTQIVDQEELVKLMARAKGLEMFIGVESFNPQILIKAHKTQNLSDNRKNILEKYHKITRLCKKYGIISHFSNMIGFPEDTTESILEHLKRLKEVNPDIASFYILTPIPGTEQYGEFREQGLIIERNMDRFDGTNPTWLHPSLSHGELSNLLFHCYRNFNSPAHLARLLGRVMTSKEEMAITFYMTLGYSLFSRYSAMSRRHPMSGGISNIIIDNVRDYLPLRKQVFNLSEDLIPLPDNLPLTEKDEVFNKDRSQTKKKSLTILSEKLTA